MARWGPAGLAWYGRFHWLGPALGRSARSVPALAEAMRKSNRKTTCRGIINLRVRHSHCSVVTEQRLSNFKISCRDSFSNVIALIYFQDIPALAFIFGIVIGVGMETGRCRLYNVENYKAQ
ncbi:hypothetical protein DFH94DRAFT_157441 [Russula ochroleuca]|uniref:Uncharacterized protein n=1 Tax=Russula ochroleuca TaxID=152965 RepID=A0A9P5TCZ2_9AGAM|nr:hypothetical protein DFH94DRAFT_157441 [Russula ochroleuca]